MKLETRIYILLPICIVILAIIILAMIITLIIDWFFIGILIGMSLSFLMLTIRTKEKETSNSK